MLIFTFYCYKYIQYYQMSIFHHGLVRLENNPVKDYAWGSTSPSSYVATLAQYQQKKLQRFAEFWMGSHCNGESQIKMKDQNQNTLYIKLTQFLSLHHLNPLEYLFKVLSIEKCLSIQVHPSKGQAFKLHSQSPEIYTDANDKPEMFYTLSDFQCFLGYIQHKEFKRIIEFPVFREKFKSRNLLPQSPKQGIIAILSFPQESQKQLVAQCLMMLQDIHPSRYKGQEKKDRKIWKILLDFPSDIGIVISFFLQYYTLPAHHCYFINSNVPHAYIYGECLEIMRNSDNVCRIGLTPKFKDLKVIEDILGNQTQLYESTKPDVIQEGQVRINRFMKNKLCFQIIRNHQPNNWEKQHQFEMKVQEKQKIMIALQGKFMISEKNEKGKKQIIEQQVIEGSVILLKPFSLYLIKILTPSWFLCAGSSQY